MHTKSKTKSYQPRRKTSEVERTFQEILLKSLTDLSKKIINSSLDVKQGQFTEEELDIIFKILKTKKLQVLIKYSLKFGWQENLMTYFSVYATKHDREIDKKLSFPYSRKVTLESLRTTEGFLYSASHLYPNWNWEKKRRRKSEWLLKKLLPNLTDSDNLLNHRRVGEKNLGATQLFVD